MKLYLDNSFLNRPFDDLSITRNQLEAEILELIIEWAKVGKVQIVNSDIIEYENSLNLFHDRKQFVENIMKLATVYQDFNELVRQRAKMLRKEFNLTIFDARHLASAEVIQVDFFITCDDTLARKYKGKIKVIAPVSIIQYYEDHY